METFQAIILGFIQGLTEFLPIPSSAHLVLVPYFAGWELPQQEFFIFQVLVHWGTLLALVVYFWKDIITTIFNFFTGILKGQPFKEPKYSLGWYIILATIPAVLMSLILKDWVQMAFKTPIIIGIFLIITAVLLLCAEYFSKQTRKLTDLTWKDSLWIGCFQIISIFPGISRFSSTIMGGLVRHFDRGETTRFSLLLSAPIMLAVGFIQLVDLSRLQALSVIDALPAVIPGFLAAAVGGYFSIKWLMNFIKNNALSWFSAYCFLLGGITLFVSIYVNR